MLPGSEPRWVAAVAQVRRAHAVETLKAGAEPGSSFTQGNSVELWLPHSTTFYHYLVTFQKGAGHSSLDITPQTVSPPSPGLREAELEMGSAPGIAFITHGGEGQAGQFLCIFPTEGAGS